MKNIELNAYQTYGEAYAALPHNDRFKMRWHGHEMTTYNGFQMWPLSWRWALKSFRPDAELVAPDLWARAESVEAALFAPEPEKLLHNRLGVIRDPALYMAIYKQVHRD